MPDQTDDSAIRSVLLDPFPTVFGDDDDRIMWFSRHLGTEEAERPAHRYPELAARGRALQERRREVEDRVDVAEDRLTAAATRNQAAARAGRAASTARSEALRMDGIREYGLGERRASEQPADPDLTGGSSKRLTVEELRQRLTDAARRREPAATARLVTVLEGFLGTRQQQRHIAQEPQPVEIRRPSMTPIEVFAVLVGAAVNTALGIAVVRAAARRVFGVEVSRRDAWLLMAAGSAITRGSGYQVWTRQQRKAGR